MNQYAIWWLNQRACELAVALGADTSTWPEYIKEEFDSRVGRPGNGRLWVPQDFEFPGIEWKDGDAAFDAVAKDCGGIVILRTDAHHVLSWPGFVSGADLRPIQVASVA